MPEQFKLPDLGEGIHEGEILKWHVAAGDSVEEDAPLVDVETDKAAVEIPSPYTGTIAEIFISPGDLVHVGDMLMSFSNGEDEADVRARRHKALQDFQIGPHQLAEALSPVGRQNDSTGSASAGAASTAHRVTAANIEAWCMACSPKG